MQKFELGNYSELIILSAYLEAGFTVSIPFGSGASCDLLVDTRRVNKAGEVDYLAIYCPSNNSLYGISIKNHPTGGWLRLEPVKNGQSKHIRWAADYTWEKHIKDLKVEYARQELNLRPFGSEPNALSPELRARKQNYRTNKIDSQQI
jgi:hypothetical protein